MRMLVISDIHARTDMVQRLILDSAGTDCIVVGGDITHFGGYADAAKVMDPILASQIPVVAVAGNCDTDDAEQYLTDKGINIGSQYSRVGNFVFIGVGGSLPCPKPTPLEFGDQMLERVLSKGLCQAREIPLFKQKESLIVVSHQPAFGTKVDSVNGRYTGSKAVRKFIETHHPLLAVSGHIHEAFGIDTIDKTMLVNPGPLKDGRYAVVEINGENVQIELCILD